MFAQESVMENPEKIEIAGLKTIHKLCNFGADRNMEGCTFTEIVERMFDELAKAQAVPKDSVAVSKWTLALALNSIENNEDNEDIIQDLQKLIHKAQEPAND